jgi:hypothetical protein
MYTQETFSGGTGKYKFNEGEEVVVIGTITPQKYEKTISYNESEGITYIPLARGGDIVGNVFFRVSGDRTEDFKGGELVLLKTRWTATKGLAIRKVAVAFPSLATLERTIKSVLNTAGVPLALMPFYLSFARQVWKTKVKHDGTIATNEIDAYKQSWAVRGLDTTVMDDIVSQVLAMPTPTP